MITHPPFFSSTFFALGAGDLTGDLAALAGVAFLATPPLGATAFAFGDLAGVFFAGVFFAGVLGFAGAAFEGVVRVDARVGVGAGAGAGADFFAGVAFFAGDFAFAGDLAPPEPRNLSLKSLFDRFFSCALNASSARIFAQAPAETNERGGNVSERFRNVSSRFAKKKRRDGVRVRARTSLERRGPRTSTKARWGVLGSSRRAVSSGRDVPAPCLATPAASAAVSA